MRVIYYNAGWCEKIRPDDVNTYDRCMKDNPGYRHLMSVMMFWIMMTRYGLSIRGMIA